MSDRYAMGRIRARLTHVSLASLAWHLARPAYRNLARTDSRANDDGALGEHARVSQRRAVPTLTSKYANRRHDRRTARSTFGRPHAIELISRQIVEGEPGSQPGSPSRARRQWHCPTITASRKPTKVTPRQPSASFVLALCISAFAGVTGGGTARSGWPHRGHAVAIEETPTPHAAHGTSCIGCMTCREAHRLHYATIGGAS